MEMGHWVGVGGEGVTLRPHRMEPTGGSCLPRTVLKSVRGCCLFMALRSAEDLTLRSYGAKMWGPAAKAAMCSLRL